MDSIPYDKVLALDNRLKVYGLRRVPVPVPVNGNSFFCAVCKQLDIVLPNERLTYDELREKCIDYLQRNASIGFRRGERWTETLGNESLDDYLSRMSDDQGGVDHLMVQTAATVLKCAITIVVATGNADESVLLVSPKEPTTNDRKIILGYVPEGHYFSAEDDFMATEQRPLTGIEVTSASFAQKVIGTTKKPTRPPLPMKPAIKTGANRRPTTNLHPTFKDDNDEVHKKPKDSMELLRNRHSGQDDAVAKMFGDFDDSGNMDTIRQRNQKERDITGELDNMVQKPRKEPEKKKWDKFIVVPEKEASSQNFRPIAQFFTKYFITAFFFLAVVIGSLASKGSLLVLTNAYSSEDYPKSATELCPTVDGQNYYLRYMTMLILMTCLCFPEFLTFGYCFYKIIMRGEDKMDWTACLKGMIPEILNAIGLTFMVLKVVPYIDSTLSVLMFSLVGFVPSMFHLHSRYSAIQRAKNSLQGSDVKRRRLRDLIFGILGTVLQPVGIALLCWVLSTDKPEDVLIYIYVVVSLLFISCRYWENFVSDDLTIFGDYKLKFFKVQKQLDRNRFKTGIIYSLVRMIFIVGCCFLIYFVIDQNKSIVELRGNRKTQFKDYTPRPKCKELVTSFWFAGLTHCLCGLGVFFFGRIACQIQAQIQGYTFPLLMATPLTATLTALYASSGSHPDGLSEYFDLGLSDSVAPYISWRSHQSIAHWEVAVIIIIGLAVGWLTIALISFFLWTPKELKLARTEVLFVKPIYGGILISEDMIMNRRQYFSEFKKRRGVEEDTQRQRDKRNSKRRSTRRFSINTYRKFTPQVFLCATMWHETDQEMLQLLTSIMRLDDDQGRRRPDANKDDNFYNFQVHVMFDDAMEKTVDGKKPNKWVFSLINQLTVAANKVIPGSGDSMSAPVLFPTPYGGRLEFVLPRGNMFHVHLKDKDKIRHRKRWSQCMYMYYILGYLQETKRTYREEDVFLLALDGDVDFQPDAVIYLLDRMKRNPDVGAACGRIHPVGSGPVVWFQKFEYAVGHWLQKTAEHVLGCVLCSPGCFSLFRGRALADINVVNMYTKKPSEARHYIQWDQGEDRWLCTLLLKRGWRIEYAAASDSYTFAPEEFKEFYNQRRRWGPSTMANVFDILQDSTLTIKNNPYISWGYISYQMGLMASSILGPATVVLVIQGSFQYVFRMSAVASLLIALIPVVIFIILCYTTDQDFQIAVAGILTIIYALVMMAVLVGIIGQMTETLLNPNSIFMLTMIFMYAFTGIIHPTEMMCLLHGLLYYLCVPSAFILLMVYSLCNMNNVSWGTREVRAPVALAEEQQKKAMEAQQDGAKEVKKQSRVSSIFDPKYEEGYGCKLGNMCKLQFCLHPKSPPPTSYRRIPTEDPHVQQQRRKSTMYKPVTGADKTEMIRKYSLAKASFMGETDEESRANIARSLNHRQSLYDVKAMASQGNVSNVRDLRRSVKQRKDTLRNARMSRIRAQELAEEIKEDERKRQVMQAMGVTGTYDDDDFDKDDTVDEIREEEEAGQGLYWIVDGPLEDGIIDYLDEKEHEFWVEMINKYLLPLDEDKTEKARIESDLSALKNKMTGAYFLINALWIVLTFSLTLAISDINITFYDKNGEEIVLQPLSFLFLIFFLVILVIQFLAMLVHRWSTFVHLMASTEFSWPTTNHGDGDDEEKTEEEGGDGNRGRRRRNKNRRARTQEASDVETGQSTSEYVNEAYEDTNFSYKPPENRPNGNPVIHKTSDASDLETPHITNAGSLRWRNGEAGHGIAAALAKVDVHEPNGDYAQIGPKDLNEGPRNVIFQEPKSSGGMMDYEIPENAYDDVITSEDDEPASTVL